MRDHGLLMLFALIILVQEEEAGSAERAPIGQVG